MTRDVLKFFDDRIVFVTGGTGSFGKAIVTRLLQSKVAEVRVFSRDEQKHVALQREFTDPRLKFMVGDVRDPSRLALAMRGSELVFNAAAIKHVHFTEMHPYEAVLTNIVGAYNVLRAAMDNKVSRLVTISTDKAVQPVNVMGMTKAIQERLITAYSGVGGLKTGCIRYGNVLASNGSVVPFFKSLLEKGERVLPVTDPKMTRYMLTLSEGIDLVLYACSTVEDGETMVMHRPAFRVVDLAEVMLEAYGGGEIRLTGIRPGEKIHETLLSSEEMRRATNDGDFYTVHRYKSENEVFEDVDRELRSDNAKLMTKDELGKLLKAEKLL